MKRALRMFLAALLLGAPACLAQAPPPSEQPAAQPAPVFKPEELDQILAPIALYPDPLLAQILMAATYPLEVVEAERWLKVPEHAKLKDDALTAALEKESWDPSVKSLVPFPQILQMMSDQLSWTQRLGDAVLAQRKDVMETVQRLRKKAHAEGSLKTTEQQKVVVEQGGAVVIEPAKPDVVYVPTYNPTVVYGAWPYPAYPPVYYPPPPAYYPAGSAFMSGLGFATGVAVVGSIWGWGNCDWHGDNLTVNYNTYNNINRTNIEAGRATRVTPTTGTAATGTGTRTAAGSAGANWQHQPSHRGGVAYRDAASRQAYQRPMPGSATARQQYRGYANTATASPAARSAPPQRGTGQARLPSRGAAPGSLSASGGRQSPAAFRGIDSGRTVTAQSSRGLQSRQSAAARPAAPQGGLGAGRSGGGGLSGGGRGAGGARAR